MKTSSICRVALRLTAGMLLGVLVVNCDIEPEKQNNNGDCAGPYEPDGYGDGSGGTHEPPRAPYWTELASDDYLRAISADASVGAIAVGDRGLIVPLNGNTPITDLITAKNLYDVWVGDNFAFAVGELGKAMRFDGSTWNVIPISSVGNMYGVWATSANDAFAVGQYGNIAHFDGSAWSVWSAGINYNLYSVWGSSSSDVFAVGDHIYPHQPAVFHYDGTTWTQTGMVDASRYLGDVWGTSADNIYAVGGARSIVHYDGVRWISQMVSPGESDLRAVWGSSSSNIYAVGTGGAMLHYDGTRWTDMIRVTDLDLADIAGTNRNDIHLLATGTHLFHYNGSAWTPENVVTSPGLNAVWAQSDDNAYVVGEKGTIINRRGNLGLAVGGMPSGSTNDLFGVWGNSPGSVYAVGANGTLLHYNGIDWNPIVTGTTVTLRDVWSGSDENVYVVGDDGTILEGGNDAFTRVVSNAGADLSAVWGTTRENVYAVGDGGTLLHYDGSSWKRMNSGTTEDLFGVWTNPLGDLVVVGANATFRTYKLGWKAVEVPAAGDIRSLWGTDFKHLHAVAAPNFLFFNGNEVRTVPIDVPVTGTLTAVHGASQGRAFAVADDGSMYDYFGVQQ